MPIKPENRARYPRDWDQIALAVKAEAAWRCEGSPAYPDCRAFHGVKHPVTGAQVVLTVAHLDHQPENCARANLRAWCQRCHNTYDAPHRRATAAETRAKKAEAEVARLTALLNAPEVADFVQGCMLEAPHQRERWGADHDAGKSPLDWFWLIGFLAQKAAFAQIAGDTDKALHHTISTAAALANWHAAISGQDATMRPGIAPPEGEIA